MTTAEAVKGEAPDSAPGLELRGNCRVLYCIDVAPKLDLDAAQQSLRRSTRTTFRHKSGTRVAEGVSSPLRLAWRTTEIHVGEWATAGEVELSVYDLGVICVTWTVPFAGPLQSLIQLSTLLYDNAGLRAGSQGVAATVLETLGSAVGAAKLGLLEDYVFFQVPCPPAGPSYFVTDARSVLAGILRAEEAELSEQEAGDSLANEVSYRADDLCVVDWLGAFLVGSDTEDERFVLERANVELLELRLLDARLDAEIREAYRTLARRRGLRALIVESGEIERLGRMQADGAVLHEGIDNALKLIGDDYLARLYQVAGKRFHFGDWDASIERKIGVLRSVYEGLADLAAHRRSEILEWIIIVLIAVDILVYLG